MRQLLVQSGNATPLVFVAKESLPSWLEQQNEVVKSWVSQLSKTKPKFIAVPSQDGAISMVVVLTESLEDCWLAGDLATLLPKGIYSVDGSKDFVEKVAFSFVMGGYQFDAYKTLDVVEAKLLVTDSAIYDRVNRVTEALYLARDLVNTPALS